jgi:hypothetical protein
MRRFTFPLLAIMICSSCSTYQYMTLDSPQLSRNEKKQFISENDTLRLTYDFNGYAAPMSINIYNKTNQPLYINWKKSALIRDEHSISLYDRNVNFSGVASSSSARFGYLTNTATAFNGSFALPEGMDFVAPGSSISKTLIQLGLTGPMPALISDSVPKQKTLDTQGFIIAQYQHILFNERQSPVKIKTYLTFSLGSNPAAEFAERNSFFVSEAYRTKTQPDNFSLYTREGDKFYVRYHPD